MKSKIFVVEPMVAFLPLVFQGKWAYESVYPGLRLNLEERLGFEAGKLDLSIVDGVWNLCKTQASILDNADEACKLLSEEDLLTLSWLDDARSFLTKGQGDRSQCAVAKPLAADLVYWLKVCIAALLPASFDWSLR